MPGAKRPSPRSVNSARRPCDAAHAANKIARAARDAASHHPARSRSALQLVSQRLPSVDVACSQRVDFRGDVRPARAHQHLAAVDHVLADQRADAFLESPATPTRRSSRACGRRATSCATVGACRIERAHAHATVSCEIPVGRLEHVVADVAEAAHHRPIVQRAVELLPGAGLRQTPIAHAPFAREEFPVLRGLRRRVVESERRRNRARAREVVAPVDLPVLAAVGRKSLVPVRTLAAAFRASGSGL